MKIWKIIFWTSTILLAFVNPLISFGLLVLYYAPELIRSICSPVSISDVSTSGEFNEPDRQFNSGMKSYSNDTLEGLK